MCENCKSSETCSGSCPEPQLVTDREKVVVLRQALMQIIQVENDGESELAGLERGIEIMSVTGDVSGDVAVARNAINALRRCRD